MAKKNKSPDDFWREYEEKTGEKVLSRTLGQYISGWDEFEGASPLWGLIIATSGGFRFHHFPQANWITALSNIGGRGETPQEKIIFIKKENIISADIKKETKWYKKLFSPSAPRLTIRYRDEPGNEKELLLLVEFKTDGFTEALAGKR